MEPDCPLARQIALRDRLQNFAVVVTRLCQFLPSSLQGRHVAGQLIRSSTSVAANYRAACRGRSRAEWMAKIGIVVEEADETVFWLDLLIETGIVTPERSKDLLQEATELVAIFGASLRTAKAARKNDSVAK